MPQGAVRGRPRRRGCGCGCLPSAALAAAAAPGNGGAGAFLQALLTWTIVTTTAISTDPPAGTQQARERGAASVPWGLRKHSGMHPGQGGLWRLQKRLAGHQPPPDIAPGTAPPPTCPLLAARGRESEVQGRQPRRAARQRAQRAVHRLAQAAAHAGLQRDHHADDDPAASGAGRSAHRGGRGGGWGRRGKGGMQGGDARMNGRVQGACSGDSCSDIPAARVGVRELRCTHCNIATRHQHSWRRAAHAPACTPRPRPTHVPLAPQCDQSGSTTANRQAIATASAACSGRRGRQQDEHAGAASLENSSTPHGSQPPASHLHHQPGLVSSERST